MARGLAAAGLKVGLAARNIDKLAPLAAEIGAERFAVDASDPAAVARLFEAADARLGEPDVVLYNASARAPGADRRTRPGSGAQGDRDLGLRRLPRRAAGGPAHAPARQRRHPADRRQRQRQGLSRTRPPSRWASSRLRGLAQSTARELAPKGIHVAHFVIDGGVRSARRPDPADRPDSTLDPDAIAQTYLDVLRQPRSAWSLEVELRPWVETF